MEILDSFNIPYTGSGKLAIDVSNDKVTSKYLFLESKIPTAKFMIIDNPEKLDTFNLTFPVILKLPAEHSSIGMDATNVVYSEEQFIKRVKSLHSKYHQDILVDHI